MAITMTPTTLGALTVGQAMTPVTLVGAGGTGPYVFTVSAGALPAGLALNSSTGVISGTPTTPGNFQFTITAEDAVLATGVQAFGDTIPLPAAPPNQLDYTAENMGSVTVAERVSGQHQTGRLSKSVAGFVTAYQGADTAVIPDSDAIPFRRDKVIV